MHARATQVLTRTLIIFSLCTSWCAQSASEQPIIVPEWSSQSMLSDIPCHAQIPDYRFMLTEHFTPENALILMISSWLGHSKDLDLIRRQLQDWGFINVWLLGRDSAGVKGYIAEHRDFILMSFRGTESRFDNLQNSLIYQIGAKPSGIRGKIHAGWYQHFTTFAGDMDNILDNLPTPHKPLIVTGHSMGGSIALLATLHRMHHGDRLLALYTFAQPRVGDETFHNFVNQKLQGHYYRILNLTDMTPQVPPSKGAAREFAGLIIDQLPYTRMGIYETVKNLNYASHAGVAYTFLGGQTKLARATFDELTRERLFWTGLQSQLANSRSMKDIDELYKQRFSHHIPHYYICNML